MGAALEHVLAYAIASRQGTHVGAEAHAHRSRAALQAWGHHRREQETMRAQRTHNNERLHIAVCCQASTHNHACMPALAIDIDMRGELIAPRPPMTRSTSSPRCVSEMAPKLGGGANTSGDRRNAAHTRERIVGIKDDDGDTQVSGHVRLGEAVKTAHSAFLQGGLAWTAEGLTIAAQDAHRMPHGHAADGTAALAW